MPALVEVVCLPDRSIECLLGRRGRLVRRLLRAGAVAEVGTVAECLPRR
jgi:hypothetical protein